jgi:hypothetical protein
MFFTIYFCAYSLGCYFFLHEMTRISHESSMKVAGGRASETAGGPSERIGELAGEQVGSGRAGERMSERATRRADRVNLAIKIIQQT